MRVFLIDLLECPACHESLTWSQIERNGQRIERAEVCCAGCGARYLVRDGIGVFLTPDLARNDLWETGNGLDVWLRARPDAERRP